MVSSSRSPSKLEFHGRKILAAGHIQHVTRSHAATLAAAEAGVLDPFEEMAKHVESKASLFAQKLAENIESRYTSNRETLFDTLESTFSRSKILGRAPDDDPEQLHEYAKLAQNVGYIKSISSQELSKQFHAFQVDDVLLPSSCFVLLAFLYFQEEVRKTVGSYSTGKDKDRFKDEQDHYHHLLSDPAMKEKSPEVMALLASAITRTSCEAVVEGMGSVAKTHKDGRGRLQPEEFSKGK